MRIKIDKLDTLFSRYVRLRANGMCERCGGTPEKGGLHCSHFITRSNRHIRWDEDNACALCYGCHMYFHGRGLEFAEWWEKRLGEEKVIMLRHRASQTDKVDRKAVEFYLKQKVGV